MTHIPAKPITGDLLEKIKNVMEGKTPEGFHKEYHCPYCGSDNFDKEGAFCKPCGEAHVREVHVSDADPEDVRDADTHKKIDESLNEGTANTWKKYNSLEDNNDHSGCVLHMAKSLKKIGLATDDHVKQAQQIKDRHMKEGHLSQANKLDRDKIDAKLWPKFRDSFAPDGKV